jgi:opacity protein-like surface antigen
MKKILMVIALLGISAGAVSAGKDLGGGDKREEQQEHAKSQAKPAPAGKNLGGGDGRKDLGAGRAQGKNIATPRPRPKPAVHAPHPHPKKLVVVTPHHHPRPRPKTVVVHTSTATPVFINGGGAAASASSSASVSSAKSAAPETATETPREYWGESYYFGFNLYVSQGRYNQSGPGFDENYSPVGGGFDISFGYKIPYFRFGGEFGFGGFGEDVPPPTSGSYGKEEDSVSAFTFMPHVFFDVDIPGIRVAPYAGFAGGLGVVTATYDLFWYGNSRRPDKRYSATELGFVYAAMAGLRVALAPEAELNFGYRFQNYGGVELLGYENKIRAHQFNFGLTFKF